MFGGTESGTNKLGTVMVPTRFVWPYGGRRVLLSGSFTRWQDHIPMSPMEGCPTVFQVIYNLTPGYHQVQISLFSSFSFTLIALRICLLLWWREDGITYNGSWKVTAVQIFVDGEWRHDEHQPFVSGNYGVVNTIYLPREPDTIPAVFSTEIAGRSNMDVDSDPLLPEAISSTSQAEIELSRTRVSVFLSSHTAYELLPESGKVIALDVKLPVKQAFHILHEQGISVAPLWDFGKAQFVGILSASDFVLILRELGNHGSNLTEEELETHTISAWKEGKAHLNRHSAGNLRSHSRHLVHAGPYDSLKDVALKLLQNKAYAGISSILLALCLSFSNQYLHFLWVLGFPKIGESNGKPIAMLRPNASLGAALSLLVEADVSSIPVVDENDSLVDVYSRSDITALAKDRAYAQVRLDDLSIHQALQLGQDAISPRGFFNGQRCQMCLRSDPLQKVMERLSIPGVRRVVIVEAGSKRVEGIISLSDAFSFLLG
ncbi:UNVERIFIED_CONTAM: Sucrose nonfermenting 4-like protein [Sesamum calycinum]|uniref:Sucrose nonfermenting 4-like protein n=1 Tax=Sesamum calycinum TaxID=2727403 RepID=A0AAW2PMC8_9LAMI